MGVIYKKKALEYLRTVSPLSRWFIDFWQNRLYKGESIKSSLLIDAAQPGSKKKCKMIRSFWNFHPLITQVYS